MRASEGRKFLLGKSLRGFSGFGKNEHRGSSKRSKGRRGEGRGGGSGNHGFPESRAKETTEALRTTEGTEKNFRIRQPEPTGVCMSQRAAWQRAGCPRQRGPGIFGLRSLGEVGLPGFQIGSFSGFSGAQCFQW